MRFLFVVSSDGARENNRPTWYSLFCRVHLFFVCGRDERMLQQQRVSIGNVSVSLRPRVCARACVVVDGCGLWWMGRVGRAKLSFEERVLFLVCRATDNRCRFGEGAVFTL